MIPVFCSLHMRGKDGARAGPFVEWNVLNMGVKELYHQIVHTMDDISRRITVAAEKTNDAS